MMLLIRGELFPWKAFVCVRERERGADGWV
jgi:hypothetical protein